MIGSEKSIFLRYELFFFLLYKYMTFGIISHKLEYFNSKIAQWGALKKDIFLILILREIKIIQNNFRINFREARDLSFKMQ